MGVKSIEPKQRGFVRILRQVDATKANHGLSVEGKKVMKEQVPTKVSKHVKCKNGRKGVGGGGKAKQTNLGESRLIHDWKSHLGKAGCRCFATNLTADI